LDFFNYLCKPSKSACQSFSQTELSYNDQNHHQKPKINLSNLAQGTDPNPDSWESKSRTSNPAFDWIRGAYGSKSSNPMFRSLEDEVAFLRTQRIGDGNSSGKVSDSESGGHGHASIPYEVLLQDLTQAKRQLIELHSLVSVWS
jgi:hypothetical protein